MTDHEPTTDYDESFHGFEMTDEQIGHGPWQPVAVELKHVFEQLSARASSTSEAMFLPQPLQDALSNFFWRPDAATLAHILQVSPSLHDSVAPSLLRHLPPADQ